MVMALLLCAGLVGGMAANATVSISFNETLAGFDMPGGSEDDTIAVFEAVRPKKVAVLNN